MYIFNQRPQSEQRLMDYFNKLVNDLKIANFKYKEQNDYLKARVRKLEQDAFYYSVSTSPMKLVKENRKLKQSLRKLYEKYIKPTQGMKLGTKGKVMSENDKWKSLVFGSRYAQRPLTPDKMTSRNY